MCNSFTLAVRGYRGAHCDKNITKVCPSCLRLTPYGGHQFVHEIGALIEPLHGNPLVAAVGADLVFIDE